MSDMIYEANASHVSKWGKKKLKMERQEFNLIWPYTSASDIYFVHTCCMFGMLPLSEIDGDRMKEGSLGSPVGRRLSRALTESAFRYSYSVARLYEGSPG